MNKPTRIATPLLVALMLCVSLAPVRSTAQAPVSQTQNPQTTGSPSSAPQPSVKLNLIVVDESNHLVADVRQEEVSVLEDGVPQTITYFAKEELPVSYALLIDNSGSMRPVLDLLIKIGGSFVVANKPGDETAIMRFVDSDNIKVLADFTENRAVLGEGLDEMMVEGGQTAMLDAVYLAVERAARRREGDSARRRAVVLITDGDERASYNKTSQVYEQLRKNDVEVFVLGLVKWGSDAGSHLRPNDRVKLLDSIAQESGGHALYPKKVNELADAVNEISREMRSRYVIGYTSANAATDGKLRKVEVRIADAPGRPKRTAVTRAGYYAPGVESKEKDKKK